MEPAFVRKRLFRPFDSTKGSKGMGIGAYQAREFIRNAGGDIDVESQAGQGTTFRISLPVVQTRSSEQRLQQAGSGK
jgi:signal transduction histidine kinase